MAPAVIDPKEQRRRNVRLAVLHAVLAAGILAWFVWAQLQR